MGVSLGLSAILCLLLIRQPVSHRAPSEFQCRGLERKLPPKLVEVRQEDRQEPDVKAQPLTHVLVPLSEPFYPGAVQEVKAKGLIQLDGSVILSIGLFDSGKGPESRLEGAPLSNPIPLPTDDPDILTWDELVTQPDEEEEFLLRPYIPTEGLVLLYGTTSIGKSPLCWHIAYCVGEGVPFFGLPVKKGPVLFIEMDSTKRGSKKRLKKWGAEGVHGVTFCFLNGLKAERPDPKSSMKLMEAIRRTGPAGPSLVVVNSLRKAHGLDDKDSSTVKLVYDWFQMMFPRTAILFVHHETKAPKDPAQAGVLRERFSGSNAWLNDAQVGLHLRSGGGRKLQLWHVKSQESELYKPLPMELAKDGTHLSCPLLQEQQIVADVLATPGLSATQMDTLIASRLKCSERKARGLRTNTDATHPFDLLSHLGTYEDESNESDPSEPPENPS